MGFRLDSVNDHGGAPLKNLKYLLIFVLVATLMTLITIWLAINNIFFTFVFSVASVGYPENWIYVGNKFPVAKPLSRFHRIQTKSCAVALKHLLGIHRGVVHRNVRISTYHVRYQRGLRVQPRSHIVVPIVTIHRSRAF